MFTNYKIQNTITTYGNNTWNLLTGFEQVLTNGITTYYALDFGGSRVVTFDQYWNFQNYSITPYIYSYSLKYVNGYFYFTANDYFYKTDMNFKVNSTYQPGSFVGYRQMYFDSTTSLFWVAPFKIQSLQIFDTNCRLNNSISLGLNPYGLNYFNGNFYVSTTANYILVVSKATLQVSSPYNCLCSQNWLFHVTIDLFGFMVISAANGALCLFNTSSVTYTYQYFAPSSQPYASSVDASGRYVVMATSSLYIYY